MKQNIINSTQTAALTLLKNKEYFSKGNKRFFNIIKTKISSNHNNTFFMILEFQNEFLPGTNTKHNVLKFVAKNKTTTITGGFSNDIDGKLLHYALKEFFNTSLGYFENNILNNLVSIEKSKDYKNTYLFESKKSGFYLTINSLNDIKIILHK